VIKPIRLEWAHTSFYATGFKEPFDAMTWFPVVIRRKDLPWIRSVVTTKLGASNFTQAFETMYRKKGAHGYCHFNIMFTVLLNTRRDAYEWRVRSVARKGVPLASPFQATPAESGLKKFFVEPQLAVHWGHYEGPGKDIARVLHDGLCLSKCTKDAGSACRDVDRTRVRPVEWTFELNRSFALDVEPAELVRAQKERYDGLCGCTR
jgi:hypothetical protein